MGDGWNRLVLRVAMWLILSKTICDNAPQQNCDDIARENKSQRPSFGLNHLRGALIFMKSLYGDLLKVTSSHVKMIETDRPNVCSMANYNDYI